MGRHHAQIQLGLFEPVRGASHEGKKQSTCNGGAAVGKHNTRLATGASPAAVSHGTEEFEVS